MIVISIIQEIKTKCCKDTEWVATFEWVVRKDFSEKVTFKWKPG